MTLPLYNSTGFYRHEDDIVAWLLEHKIRNFELIEDPYYGFKVNTKGKIKLFRKQLEHIPVKFGMCEGEFDCSGNQLKSLKFAPDVAIHDFYCQGNQISSLEGCPEIVGGHFSCESNQLTSLKWSPRQIGGSFGCAWNKLTSLQYCPLTIYGSFDVSFNEIETLFWIPQLVDGTIYFDENKPLSLSHVKSFEKLKSEHLEFIKKIQFKERIEKEIQEKDTLTSKIKI